MANTQSILAYFNSPDQAEKAKQGMLEQLDLTDETCQIDRISAQPGDATEQVINPINASFSSHATLIENLSPTENSSGILLGSDPAVSGMSDGTGMLSGRDTLLTVVCPADKLDRALQIIEQNGGQH
ncbi:hypothetical protein [Tumebacillus lipolyticus]|uniref:General stress protein 17M-like domain-containing protein n=1 Tax=Tumebacillus lipolyticus TaxID=1280370 RepID=A0ABW4ZZF3_9BACL